MPPELSSCLIQRLPRDVVSRIAAGEVVQRPSAALKELLENSLDAQSTSIAVAVQDGGLGALQVTDDGEGVRYSDLPLLCERHATSKLRTFADLECIDSFGFRGEALASISYVSRVTVTTRRRVDKSEERPSTHACDREAAASSTTTTSTSHEDKDATLHCGDNEETKDGRVAWRCIYLDGVLTGPPQPCAGNCGTIVRAERMFYNAQVRRTALKPAEEWRRLLDVVSRYALAFPEVSFSCHKEGSVSSHDGLVFPKNSTTLDNLRLLLGSKVAAHLRPIYYVDSTWMQAIEKEEQEVGHENGEAGAVKEALKMECGTTKRTSVKTKHASSDETNSATTLARVRLAAQWTKGLTGSRGEGVFALSGYTSDATLLSRKGFLALFVNQRLVESSAIRRAVDAVYSSVLTGGNRPVTVLLLTVPAARLDVNVHPTKKEVYFLDEEVVTGRLMELLRAALVEAAAEKQVDVTSLSKATTLALQAAVRYGGCDSNGEGPSMDGAASSAIRGVRTFQQHQQQQQSQHRTGHAGFSAGTRGTHQGFGTGAPSTTVRLEPQKGALDAFLLPSPSHGPQKTQQPQSQQQLSLTREAEGAAQQAHEYVERNAVEHERNRSDAVNWASVLASVRPVGKSTAATESVKGEETAPAVAAAVEPCSSGAVRAFVPRETIDGTPGGSQEKTSALSMQSRGNLVERMNPTGARDDHEDDDSADNTDGEDSDDDAMREFKRARAERANEDTTPAATALSPFTSTLVVDDTESNSNLVQVLPAGDHTDTTRSAPCTTEIGAAGAAGVGNDSAMIAVPQLEDHVLTSVAGVVDDIVRASSGSAQLLMESLSYVGIVDGESFLAQSGTSLLAVNTLRLVREVVRQRIFLRWAQPSLPRPPRVLVKGDAGPIHVIDAILFALLHDASTVAPSVVTPASPLLRILRRAATTAPAATSGTAPAAAAANLAGHFPSRPAPPPSAVAVGSRRMPTDKDLHDFTTDHTATPAAGAALSPADSALLSGIPTLLFDEGGAGAMGETRPPQPTSSCRRYARILATRLDQYRDMLEDYFDVCISHNGELLALPCGLNTAWPPCVRSVPLFLWLLAETVPFPRGIGLQGEGVAAASVSTQELSGNATGSQQHQQPAVAPRENASQPPLPITGADSLPSLDDTEAEAACFRRITGLIADVLYGMTTSHLSINATEVQPVADESALVTEAGKEEEREGQQQRVQQHKLRRQDQHRTVVGKAIQLGLLPCLRSRTLFLAPAQLLSDGTLQSVVTVETLYKVFERC